MEKLFNVTEASEFLGVTRKTVHLWLKQNKIKYTVSPGGRKFFTEKQLKEVYKEV